VNPTPTTSGDGADPTGTGAQVLAADPTVSVWVSANAGTGKTRVLVDRITRLLLSGTQPERILCLTFTKAAAAEMANRLNERLGRWAAATPEGLAEDLTALLGRPPETAEAARARRLFAETMETPEGLRIRTIHSFCESLLGRFPLEAGVAPHFQVVDERRAAELRQETRDALLLASIEPGARHLARAMNHLAGLVDENGFAGVMGELDSERGRLAALMAAHGGLDGLMAAGRRALELAPGDTAASVIAAATARTAYNQDALAAAAEALGGGSPKDKERGAQLADWLAADHGQRVERFQDMYVPLFLTQKNAPRAATGLITKKRAEDEPDALEALLSEQDRVFRVQEKLKAVAVADNTAALLTMGVALLESYDTLKARRALLDYDDLIDKARQLLRSEGGVSWVHFKLDGGISHILVDEAQDTSPAQWAVIEALAGDFFTGQGREAPVGEEASRTVFAVGDEKQSIYSFQGADPARFGLMGRRFGERVVAAEQPWRPVEMAQSWRSTPAVLRAVDAVFSQPDAADGLSWNDRPVFHRWTREGQAGLVELWPLAAPAEADDADPWDAPLDQMAGDDPRGRLADTIATTIDAWLKSGERLESRGRPVTPGDIMILLRTRGAFAEEMVRSLKDRNIPVAGRDRLVLTEHLAVMDLVALGRFALLPDDDLNTATVLKGPFVELDEETLFDLAHQRAGSLWQELTDRSGDDPALDRAHGVLRDTLARADQTPPFEFFSHLLNHGGRRALLAHLGPEAADPVDEFMALALDFERDHVPSLEGFLHWLETGRTEVKRDLEQAGGEVRVMTIHGAKGLQAPVVFLIDNGALPARQLQDRMRWSAPGVDEGYVLWPAFKDNEGELCAAIAETKRLETEREYRRLLYVAMTRAEDRLYVAGWHGKRGPDENCWHALVEAGLGGLEGVEEVVRGDGASGLRFATPQTADPMESQAPLPLSGGETALPPWARERPLAEPTPPRPLAPSRPEDDPPAASPLADDGARFKRGRLIHSLLQSLPELAAEARPAALAAYLALPAHELTAAQQTEIGGEVLAVLEHPDFKALFGPGSRAEVPVVGDVGTIEPCVISGQVDRLLITDDEVTVIDFKTNRPPPRDQSEVAGVYLRQMAAYRAALRRIYPERRITAVLLWTDGPRLMRLDDEVLDPHAP